MRGVFRTPAADNTVKRYVDAVGAEAVHEARIFAGITAAIEVASESTDIWFTATALVALNDQSLFYASVAVLGSQLVLRLCIGLAPLVLYREADDEGPTSTIFGEGSSMLGYLGGLALTLVSPLNGITMINESMSLTSIGSNKFKSQQIRATDLVHRAHQLQVALLGEREWGAGARVWSGS